MKDFFEKRMLWVVLVFILIYFYRSYLIYQNSWDLQRTIGWGWDLPNYFWWIGFGNAQLFSMLLYFSGYTVFSVLKIKTDFFLSVLHFVLLVGSQLIDNAQVSIFSSYMMICLLVFLSNLAISLRKTL